METTNLLLPSTRMTRMGMVNPTFIEDAVIVSEKEQKKEHPNFIESNTSGITLEELETNCIVPSFGDNQPPDFYTSYRGGGMHVFCRRNFR